MDGYTAGVSFRITTTRHHYSDERITETLMNEQMVRRYFSSSRTRRASAARAGWPDEQRPTPMALLIRPRSHHTASGAWSQLSSSVPAYFCNLRPAHPYALVDAVRVVVYNAPAIRDTLNIAELNPD